MTDHASGTHDPVDGWAVVERASALARQGVEFALATVVWRQAPSSGQQGSRAIITSDGSVIGWIGGACAEPIVIREAQRVIAERKPQLLLLGTPEQFGNAVPDGMRVIPISCQSEGALELYVEPVLPVPLLVVVGRSPMAETLVGLAEGVGWSARLVDWPEFVAAPVDPRALVVVATQGHGDEEAVEHAVAGRPAFVGLVASKRRAETVLGYLADRGVAPEQLDQVRAPVGLDLGHTAHREIAVAILAELVQLRASGSLAVGVGAATAETPAPPPVQALDPVCGMTVTADPSGRPFEHAGTTYYFCSAGCRQAFERDPSAYVTQEARC